MLDEDTVEAGFLDLCEDVFWHYEEEQCYWLRFPFQGHALKKGKGKGKSKKGKSKGKGYQARRFFRSYRKGTSLCRKRGDAKGDRSLFFGFGHLLVTILSFFLTFWVTFLPPPFCGRVSTGKGKKSQKGESSKRPVLWQGPYCQEERQTPRSSLACT